MVKQHFELKKEMADPSSQAAPQQDLGAPLEADVSLQFSLMNYTEADIENRTMPKQTPPTEDLREASPRLSVHPS